MMTTVIFTKTINTGENHVDITHLIKRGLNTIKIYGVDPEGTSSQLVYYITGDEILKDAIKNGFRIRKVDNGYKSEVDLDRMAVIAKFCGFKRVRELYQFWGVLNTNDREPVDKH